MRAVRCDHDQGHVTAPQGDPARPGRPLAAARVACVAFIPGDYDGRAFVPGGRAHDGGDGAANEGIALRDEGIVAAAVGGAVHVVADIGGDPGKVRKAAGCQVRAELCKWNDALETRRVVANAGEIHEGIVLLPVQSRVSPGEAHRWHRLHIGLPRQMVRLELIDERLTAEKVTCAGGPVRLLGRQLRTEGLGRAGDARPRGAIIPNTLKAAGDRRQVVRQARMRNAEIMRRDAIAARELVQIRRVGAVAENITEPMILHHNIEDVFERRRSRRWSERRPHSNCGRGSRRNWRLRSRRRRRSTVAAAASHDQCQHEQRYRNQ